MHRQEHGGGCCGINHIYGFNAQSRSWTFKLLKEAIRQRKDERRSGLMEVVLTDAQAITYDEFLTQQKFYRVARFLNSNSGNYCNVYHLRTGQNWLADAWEDGLSAAIGFYLWRELKSLMFVGIALSSIVIIQQAVLLIKELVP